MAFVALPEVKRGASRRNEVSVATFKNAGNTCTTTISIPRALYREAGLPDFPGATFDIMVGSGPDRGSVAVIAGPRFKARKVGGGPDCHRLILATSLLSGAARSSTAVEFEVGRKQIIVHFPADFEWRDVAQTAAVEAEREAA